MSDVRNKNRQNRLRAALRENLKRRKEQIRGRASQTASGTEGDESALPADGKAGDVGSDEPGRPR